MDLGNFKRRTENEDEAWSTWLGEEAVGVKPEKPTGNVLRFDNSPAVSQVKSSDGLSSSQVKRDVLKSITDNKNKQSQQTEKTIAISLELPHFRAPKVPWRTVRPWALGIAGVVLLLAGGNAVQGIIQKNTKNSPQTTPVVIPAELGYKPLERPSTSESPQVKSAFDDKKNLYTFTDVYMDANVTVNQQAMPEKLKNDPKRIASLAASLDAKEKFTSTVGEVYLQSSENSPSQRLMVVNDKMLMFIQSTKRLTAAEWVTYLQSME